MFSFGLKSGYHLIEIASEQQPFLGFSWKFHHAEGYQYSVFRFCLLIYLQRRTLSPNAFVLWKTNADKSIWEPVQSIVWLGLCWNSLNGTICITERRLNKILIISRTLGTILCLVRETIYRQNNCYRTCCSRRK